MREWEIGAVENIHGALPYIRFAPLLALVGVGVNRIGKEATSAATAAIMEVEPEAVRIRVQFGHDSAALDGSGNEAVENGARLARAPGVAEVFIEGHADSIGMSEYNLGLSLRRTEVVWRRLIESGVSAATENGRAIIPH